MNIAEFSIRRRVSTLALTIALILGGLAAYMSMGRLEDPEFTIKDAQIITQYPGASAREVAEEVTDVLESAVQQMGQLKRVTSVSKPGLSTITVTIKDEYGKERLAQVWDELRRKVGDSSASLPPGAKTPLVVDDFGDVYGIFFAVTADGYSYKELKDYVDTLRKEMLVVQDVAKVTIWGAQPEAVYVEISRARMRALGVSMNSVLSVLSQRNLVTDAGNVLVNPEYIRISPSGGIASVEELGDLFITDAGSGTLVYLRDIATITRGYVDPPKKMMRQNGKIALGVGISLAEGGNIVDLGERVKAKLRQMDPDTPVGIVIDPVYFQPDYVTKAVDGFAVSLLEAIVIVIGVLMITMGLRSGLIIGSVLLITVAGSFIFMKMMDIQLQRISLGALIIALGMLVDNAIVVTEGMLVRIQQGENRIAAAGAVVRQNLWPLLGATAIAIMAFAAIGLSEDNTGEYCGSLFWVLLISLLLSWVTAITTTPLLCEMFLKGGAAGDKDAYGGVVFSAYRNMLRFCLNNRWVTVGAMVALLVASIYGFGFVKQSFFPDSTQPQFFVDFWKPEGTDIRQTSSELKELEQRVLSDPRVEFVSTFVGGGAPRFMLVYGPEKDYSNYGQLIVTVKDFRDIPAMIEEYRNTLPEHHPEAFFKFKKVRLGPGRDDPVEIRFSGPDPEVLRTISEQAKSIMRANANAQGVRDNWREKVKVLEPVIAEAAAKRAGVDTTDIAKALQMAFTGSTVGVYREGDSLLPIIARPPADERLDVGRITDVQVWSPSQKAMIPLNQVVSGFRTINDFNLLQRRDRKYTITAACEPVSGLASVLFSELRPRLEAMKLPAGYSMEWGGEFEDSTNAQTGLASSIPPTIVLMVLITVVLFNALRPPLIIWLTVPLAAIGVTSGLLATGQPFGFMALLGFLSLSGMLIKNAIVLLDEIAVQIADGREPFNAVLEASVSRMRPVLMAAGTTVLGMLPLLMDAFFEAMAVTIMAGLTFASILTLVVVPVLYVIFYRLKEDTSA
ncbi:efflux RND transporter permease subunit [Desulfovibrio subterraneus]|uniref:efflux RND transporter permease subunit n=1 Tax=Desulfovibrio subterraneus TaxID=2718620 RepID=UPI0022B862CD|nr:efflux RND transporter permease subunit [Desulfovibrio subterraneus]WBF67078.1 efflux RND transporter permease subunit [Desulfovibrio subterraneus]